MCGIAFIYNQNRPCLELKKMMMKALKCMHHRGPDDWGLVQKDAVAIGHRRLSIIDIHGSAQPMSDPTGRYVLSYNGEVYNYRELRSSLEQKWTFETNGDTEVVLAGLVIYGESFVERMEGMWGIVLWDNLRKRLIMSRDRMGKKPLYYKTESGGVLVASELPGLACLSSESWSEDLDSTADYLRYGYYLPGTTAYKGIREVLPGHCMTWAPGGVMESNQYWRLNYDEDSHTKDQAQELLSEGFRDAVKKRLIADVEIGSFLSGGIDSSLIVAMQSELQGRGVKTFTIGFSQESYDEREYAKIVSRKYGTQHHVEILFDLEREKLVDLVFSHIGQPFSDPSILPTALVSSLAAKKLNVVLSGDGGDELFSGYERYRARSILRWYTRMPKSLRKSAEKLLRMLPDSNRHHSRSLLKKIHLFLDITDRLEDERPYIAPLMFSSRQLDALAPDLACRGHPGPDEIEKCGIDDIRHMMFSDALVYLPQDVLMKVDRATMSHSIESRSPFLDRNLVELAFSLPVSWHRKGLSGKQMLYKTFKQALPDEIWHRRKQGFGVPVGQWFKGELGNELLMLCRSVESPLIQIEVERMLFEHRKSVRDYGLRLWLIYVYILWRERLKNRWFDR